MNRSKPGLTVPKPTGKAGIDVSIDERVEKGHHRLEKRQVCQRSGFPTAVLA